MILNSYDIKYLFMKFINRGEARRIVFEKNILHHLMYPLY